MVMESDFAFAFNEPYVLHRLLCIQMHKKKFQQWFVSIFFLKISIIIYTIVLNAGGPDRLSRVQMAEAVAEVRGHDMSLIKQVSASSVDRGVVSPADISMDITKLVQTLDISPTSFKDGVRLTLESESQYFPNFRDTQLQLSVSM